MASPGSVQREHIGGPRLCTRRGGSTTSRRGLVLSLLGTRLAWDQRVRRAFSDPRAGPCSFQNLSQAHCWSEKGRWEKGLEGSRPFTHVCSQREIHMQTHSWIHTLTQKHKDTMHRPTCRHSDTCTLEHTH